MLWLTNLAAPYRVPVWDILAADDSLHVWVYKDNEDNRSWAGMTGSRPYLQLVETVTVSIRARQAAILWCGLRDTIKTLRRVDAVVIGGWDDLIYWQVSILARVLRVPRVLFYESTALSHRYTSGPVAWARRLFLRHGAEAVLVPGQAAAAAVAADGVSLDRIVVTFNSIDQAAVESAVRRSARSTSGTYRVSYVGQLIERKNVEGLLRAFYASDIADSELHIVGQGPEEQRLKRLASELQAQERPAKRAVTWHGGLAPSAALDVMVCCDLLVLSSTEEVWGLVVNEALTAGLAVVVSESSGVAASVIGMPAVHVCQATTSSLIAAMEAACREWSGWLVRPEIKLVGAPENFATSVRGAVRLARERITSHAAG